jgi:hypothetical protein
MSGAKLMNVYSTHFATWVWRDGKRAAFSQEFDTENQAEEFARERATESGLSIIHCPWTEHIEDLEKPPNCIAIEEIRIRNRTKRVYSMA